ncbi:hypothetical protein ES705_26876 [subsurface metagenome]
MSVSAREKNGILVSGIVKNPITMKKIVILIITLLILHRLSFAEKVNIETVKKIAQI